MDWDPEVESPATIAIIGAGPVGVEAALYARFLGYSILLFDQARVASGPKRWGSRSLEVACHQCTTTLGHAALLAQNQDYIAPHPDHIFTGEEFANRYVIPVAKTDLIYDDVHFNSRVTSVSRVHYSSDSPSDIQERCNDEFRLVIDARIRGSWTARADVILDCTGLSSNRDGLGPGGGQAIREAEFGPQIIRSIKEFNSDTRARFEGQHMLIVGSSYEAAQMVTEWCEMASLSSSARLTWILLESQVKDSRIPAAHELCSSASLQPQVAILSALGVEQIDRDASATWKVTIIQADETTLTIDCDQLVALTTPRPNWSFCESLRLSDPRAISSSEAKSLSENPDFKWPAWRLACKEPNYYILGSKSEERSDANVWQTAHNQIRDLFAMLGGRETLDLYSTI